MSINIDEIYLKKNENKSFHCLFVLYKEHIIEIVRDLHTLKE